jgi:hypothetical protein
MERDELLALIGRHPKMDAGAVPAEWVQVAEANYSMHGHGLLRNILAGVAPVIKAVERRRERDRILAALRGRTVLMQPADGHEVSAVPWAAILEAISEETVDG